MERERVSRNDVDQYRDDLGKFYGCLTKISYMSPIPATRAAYALECIRPGRIYSVYTCKYCGDYHVGRRKKRDEVT